MISFAPDAAIGRIPNTWTGFGIPYSVMIFDARPLWRAFPLRWQCTDQFRFGSSPKGIADTVTGYYNRSHAIPFAPPDDLSSSLNHIHCAVYHHKLLTSNGRSDAKFSLLLVSHLHPLRPNFVIHFMLLEPRDLQVPSKLRVWYTILRNCSASSLPS